MSSPSPTNQSLATTWGREIRNTDRRCRPEDRPVPRPQAGRRLDRRATLRPANESSFVAAGAQGSVTGRPATDIVMDDPIKGYVDAHSPIERNKVWNTYTTTARMRLHPGGSIMSVATRWHEDDLNGRIERNAPNPANGKSSSIPGIAEDDDILGRKPGDPLWPESGRTIACWERPPPRHRPLHVLRARAGRPRPTDRRTVRPRLLEVRRRLPRRSRFIRRWDLAATEDDPKADETVGALVTRNRKGFMYVVDLVHGRFADTGVEDLMQADRRQRQRNLRRPGHPHDRTGTRIRRQVVGQLPRPRSPRRITPSK